jgi:outer membrane cobalamin receptor
LNDLGYEIPAAEAAGALLGDSAGEGALPTGRSVRALRAESLWNAETGVSWAGRRVSGRAQFFHADLLDPIVRRTLLFPAAQVPASLAGLPVTAITPTAGQMAQNVRTVATAADPRSVKAFVNDGHARYYGVESRAHVELHRHWIAEASYSFLAGRDLYPNRNIRRLPPQNGFAAIRYLPRSRRAWVELSVQAQGAQRRLSGGDLDDERIGASRSRRDIADFFLGSRMSPYVSADGRFLPTGETLLQIQNRVLPGVADATRVALYGATAGWAAVNVRGAAPLAPRLDLNFALENLADRNYRHHGSGIDAAGFNAWLSLRWRFGGGGD